MTCVFDTVLMIPGWGVGEQDNCYPELRKVSEKAGCQVEFHIPDIRNPLMGPSIKGFEDFVAKMGGLRARTLVVAHSFGAAVLIQSLARTKRPWVVGGVLWVAPPIKRVTLPPEADTPEYRSICNHWLGERPNLARVNSKILYRSVALFSRDDPFIPVENAEDFGEGCDIVGEVEFHENAKHFSTATGNKEAPEVVKALKYLLD